MSKSRKWIFAGFIGFSFIGFLDATFLAIEHFRGSILPCYILEGCDRVTTSAYADIFGIPVSLIGSVYYLLVLVAAIAYLDTKNRVTLLVLKYLPVGGFLATLWFLYLQFFVIRAICLYCMISAISSISLFVMSICLRMDTVHAHRESLRIKQ